MFAMAFVEDKCAFISLKAPFVVNQLVASPLNVFAQNPMYEVCDFHGRQLACICVLCVEMVCTNIKAFNKPNNEVLYLVP